MSILGMGNVGYGIGAMGILAALALIAFIVLAIVGYIKFIGKNADTTSKFGRFFNFDHFFIETILKTLYLVSVIGITIFSIYTWISLTFAAGFVGVFFGLFSGVLIFAIGQFVCRMLFEASMMFVRLVVDVHDIKKETIGEASNHEDEIVESVTEPIVPEAPPLYQEAQSSASSTWTCSCGKEDNVGRFCSRCGQPRS